MKTALSIIAVVIVVLIVISLVVRTVESHFAFFPLAGETTTPRQFGVQYEALSIATDDGEQLRGWMIDAHGPAEAGHYVPVGARAHIVYFHGNGGNLSIWAPILTGIARHRLAPLICAVSGLGDRLWRRTTAIPLMSGGR